LIINEVFVTDVDIQSQVEGSLLLPPTYATVVSRAQLSLVSYVIYTCN